MVNAEVAMAFVVTGRRLAAAVEKSGLLIPRVSKELICK
jgi:hypothetical protein